ncbi:hypothetical protein FD755_015674, partial [Muntiacus reevesi]
KDRLAQLLEEKDLLQKVQIEKIQNLTQMLAKKTQRVPWCIGKINEIKDSNYINKFNMPMNITKTHKAAVKSDIFSNTLDTLTEIEWNPVTKLLSQSEFNSLCANYDNLVLDYEQLRRENEEMELKLREKNDLDEFETLERKAKKDQENELSSKVELLREKEDQIKMLQEYTDSQKSESMKMDLSYSLENTKDLKQTKQTLLDVKTVALDAKRESAFLRSENLKLKEKMKELAYSTCKQMENDMQLYQSQLETKKKMQVDLEKELQSSFSEITKLTSLIDGKKELNKAVEENEALHNEVNLMKEIHDKSEELYIVTLEKDKWSSEVVDKENRIQGLLEDTDQEFQDVKNHHIEFEQKYKKILEENAKLNQEIGNLSKELSHKTQELQQKLKEQLERRDSRLHITEKNTLITEKLQQTLVESLKKHQETTYKSQNLETKKTKKIFSLTQEKNELQSNTEMTTENQEELKILGNKFKKQQDTVAQEKKHTIKKEELSRTCEKLAEQLKEQFKVKDSSERLQESHDEVKTVAKETADLQRLQEFLQYEKNQLQENLREMAMQELYEKQFITIKEISEIQEKMNELEQLKKQLKIQELQEEEHQCLETKDVSETREKICEIENLKKQLEAQKSTLENTEWENIKLTQRLHENLVEIRSVTKEIDDLRNTEKTAQMNLKEHQETINKLRGIIQNSVLESTETEKLRLTQKLHENDEEIKSVTKERDDLRRMEGTLKMDLTMNKIEMENLSLAQKLHENFEEMKSVMKERDSLRRVLETLKLGERPTQGRPARNHISEKKSQISNIQKDLNKSKDELQKKDQQNHEEVKYEKKLLCDGNQHLTGSLREKCFRIELLKRYSEMDYHYECLNRLSLDLKKEIETQKELSVRVKANRSLPYPQTKQIQKLLTANQRCSMEFHRVVTKLQYVLSYVARTKEEQHESINKSEMAFTDEEEKQNELLMEIYDFHSIKTEFQQVLSNRKEMTQFLEECKIIPIMNELTEFEERNATIVKEWEHNLKSMKENNEKLFKKIQELETSLQKAKETALHTEGKITKMQKELEMTDDITAKFQQQDKAALRAKPYKEETEDLKMKLVKIDLEKMKSVKEFGKEIASTKATAEYQKELTRLSRENLRRNQQAQDTSMVSEHIDTQPSNKPLTCGDGSGIVQSTKALILKSYIQLEKEVSKLKQQKEQLVKQKNELEVHKEVTCENSPKSPKVSGTPSKKRHRMSSQCKERNVQDSVPKESPKSWFSDNRPKSLPGEGNGNTLQYSCLRIPWTEEIGGLQSLGLQRTVDPQPGPWHMSSGKNVPECRTQETLLCHFSGGPAFHDWKCLCLCLYVSNPWQSCHNRT